MTTLSIIFLALLAVGFVVFIYSIFTAKEYKPPTKPQNKDYDQLYREALSMFENFKTASHGFRSRKDLDYFVKSHQSDIERYDNIPEFRVRYTKLYERLLKELE